MKGDFLKMAFTDLFRIKKFKQEIEELRSKYHDDLNDANERIKELEKELQSHNANQKCFKDVDINAFCTNEYMMRFESYLNAKKRSDDIILYKFNELLNMEDAYFKGIASCIDFIRTKRKPKISIEKQLVQYVLTEHGRNLLNNVNK